MVRIEKGQFKPEKRIIDRAEAHPTVQDLFKEKAKRLDVIESYWKKNFLEHDEYSGRAKKKVEDLMLKQMNEIAAIYDARIYKLQRAAEQGDPRLLALQQELMASASTIADARIEPQMETFQETLKEKGHNTEGFAFAHQAVLAQNEFKRLTKENPQLKVVFDKFQQGFPLNDADLGVLVQTLDLQKMNVRELSPTTKITTESSVEVAFGYVLGKIPEVQRVRLAEIMLKDPYKAGVTPAFIEQMFIMGLIDEKAAENLFRSALTAKVISIAQFEEYMKKLQGGYEQAKKEYNQNIETWLNTTYRFNPYVNEAAAFVDDLPRKAVMVWAGITAAINLLPNIRKPGFGLKEFMRNPWGMLALGVGVAAKKGNIIKTEEDPAEVEKRERAENITRFKGAYRKFPADLQKYLEKDGVTSIHEVGRLLETDPAYERLPAEKKEAAFFEALMKYEQKKDPIRYGWLENLKKSTVYSNREVFQNMFHAAVAIPRLGIKNSQDLAAIIKT